MRSLDIVLSKPGIYCAVGWGAIAILEVDPEGRCYACDKEPPHPRGHELTPGGWRLDAIRAFLGPFYREPNVERERIRAAIADDAYATAFQTLGQYRNALLKMLKEA